MPTKFDPKIHHRRSIRLPGYDYSQVGAYFVTIVAQGRESFFGKIINGKMVLNDAGKMVGAVWETMYERFPTIELGAFVVMPNHFHAIVIIRDATVGAGLVPALDNGDDREGAATPVPAVLAQARAAPTKSGPTLGSVIGAFKSITTHEYVNGVDEKGWPQFNKRLWQRNYYERIIRNEREMDAIWRYIEANPTQWEDDEENQ
jgi:REP element-mobilizing transposase RayT